MRAPRLAAGLWVASALLAPFAACVPSGTSATRVLPWAPAGDGRIKAEPPPPGKARLVVTGRDFRPLEGNHPDATMIADARGQLLAEVNRGSWVRVDVEPGARTLVAWHDGYGGAPTVAVLCGDFAEGRTYFLAVGPRTRGLNVDETTWMVDTAPEALGSSDVALLERDEDVASAQRLLDGRIRDACARGRVERERGACTPVAPQSGRRFE